MATPGSTTDQGIVARAVAAAKYLFTGQMGDGWFGPGQPLPPQAPESVRGRGFDFPVAANINFRPRGTEPVNFDKLKKLATNPVVAMLLQRQKDLVCGVEWRIKPRTVLDPDGAEDPAVTALTDFFHEPDQEHDWAQWISALLDQLMVLDAVSVYVRPTRGGGVYSCELLDGSTIKPLLNELGRRPLPPSPAYQQVLKGLPAEDYTSDELIYFPQTYRVDRVYGYSRVEQALDLIEQSIARLKSQLGYWTHGNLGDGYFETPDGWTPDDVAVLEARWNQMMSGSIEGRRSTPFVPHGTVFHETKSQPQTDAYDEWLIRMLCFPFGVAPTPFMKQSGLGHGSAESDKAAAEEAGIASLLQYISRLMNRILRKHFGRADLEFTWVEDRELDPDSASSIDDRRLKNGSATINEVRDRNGEPPIEGGDEAMIYLPTGPVPVAELSKIAEDAAAARQANIEAPNTPAEPGAAAPEGGTDQTASQPTAKLEKADTKAQNRLKRAIKAYLDGKAEEIANAIAPVLGKAAMDDQSGKINSALDDVDWSWNDLPDIMEPLIAGVAVAAGTDALSELNLFDAAMLKRMTARATDYANQRAAELVGMKWVDGELVNNPNAAWSIAETTRTMIRNAVSNAVEEGASNDTLAATIRDSAAFSDVRAETIARTETATADVQGTIAGWKASGVVAGKQWLVSAEACALCEPLDGEIVDLDDDFADGDPPLHPNCLPGNALVLAAGVTGTFERPYDGNVVVVSTASGKRLTCTPNHPILTPAGWVAAGRLDVGSHVISCRFGDGTLFAGEDGKDAPARIEDVAKAFRRSGKVSTVPVPVAAPDFHGDGESSEIAIVGTNRLLVSDAHASSCKHCGKPLFFGGDVQSFEHDGSGSPDLSLKRLDLTTPGTVSGSDLDGSPGSIGSSPDKQLSLAHTATLDTKARQTPIDGLSTNVEMFGAGLLRHPADVETGEFSFVDLNAPLPNVAGLFADAIVSVTVEQFVGHVFNLETEAGLYIAEGIVTHNCECTVIAVLPEDMPDAGADTQDEE